MRRDDPAQADRLPLLAPAPSDEMFAHPVSARVNAARNDDSSLIERCAPAGEIQ